DSHTLDVESNGCSYYWLRSAPGGVGGNSFIYVVQPDGQIDPELVYNKIFGVRPVITIDLSSPIFTATKSMINWQIGSDASFLPDSTWEEVDFYREGFINKLPTDGNFSTRPDGKVLIGWLIDNGTYKVATYSIPETMKGDITLKPLWGTAGQKLINYNLYNATASEYGRFLSEPTYVYTPGTAFTLPDVSTVEDPSGNNISSWQIDGIDVMEIPSTATSDVEVKAMFNDTGTYRVEFDMGEGHLTITPPSEYTYGVELPLPASTSVVSPNGRDFSHWMLKGANGNIISENTATISDTQRGYIKVVAVYSILSYNITWNLGSGRFINSFATPSTYQYDIGLKLPASTSIIPPIGYEFNHWEIGGVATTSITKTDYGNKHVVAIYNLSTYHINWNLDDGTTGNHGEWDGTAGATSYTYATEYSLPTNIIGPTGRIFTNWEIEGIATTSIPVGSTGDKEFNAKYRNATYSVTWHDSDGNDINWISGFTATASYTYSEGMALPSTESIVLPMRMEFDYWIIRRAGETDIEYATSIAPSLTGDVDIIAVYKYVTYTINYDTVIIDADIDYNNVERTYNSADTLLSTPSKTNYKFVGWYRNYNATTHEYTNLYTGNDDIYVDGMSTYTIYAKWQVIINYNVNGHGSLSPNYEYVDLWDTTTLPTLSDVTGYTFDLTNSWYDGVDTSTATLIGSAGSIYTVTEPKVLFAHWDENIYNVTYHMNGGTWKAGAHNKSTRSYTERLTLPTSDDIEKVIGTDTYEFAGWWTMDGSTSHYWGDKVEFIAENTTEDKELYAKWNSTISFNTLGHGTQPESIEINGTLDVTLSSISEIGWTFDGWYSSATEFTVNNFIGYGGEIITFNGPKILYAKWIENSYKIILHVNGGIFNEGYTEWTLNPTTGNYEANRLYHESIILPTNSNITKDGFTFD
ncbi:MAG: InlB B-repeat-containing protein, partial [Lachnospiraceae bacterium]|nr:InlB B-repeat-containing protein [Lachnospiraceae bacterium]